MDQQIKQNLNFTPDPDRQRSSLMMEEDTAHFKEQIQPKFGNDISIKNSSKNP